MSRANLLLTSLQERPATLAVTLFIAPMCRIQKIMTRLARKEQAKATLCRTQSLYPTTRASLQNAEYPYSDTPYLSLPDEGISPVS